MRLIAEREMPEEDPVPVAQVQPRPVIQPKNDETLQLIMLGLKVLSQRTVALAVNLFPLIAVGTSVYLWTGVMAAPSTYQLVGLGMYALFMSVMLMIIKRKG